MSSLVAVETQSFLHMVSYLFGQESVDVHCIWVWVESGCWHVSVDWGLCSAVMTLLLLTISPRSKTVISVRFQSELLNLVDLKKSSLASLS